jgi:hypothetical protein
MPGRLHGSVQLRTKKCAASEPSFPPTASTPWESKGGMKMPQEAKRRLKEQALVCGSAGFACRHSGNLLAGIQTCGARGSLCGWIPAKRLPE